MRYIAILSVLILTACGVDGEPERPERATPPTGISITGTAEIGVFGSN
ncbi:hypothetical protein [Gymnodinialimonas sp.]